MKQASRESDLALQAFTSFESLSGDAIQSLAAEIFGGLDFQHQNGSSWSTRIMAAFSSRTIEQSEIAVAVAIQDGDDRFFAVVGDDRAVKGQRPPGPELEHDGDCTRLKGKTFVPRSVLMRTRTFS